VVQSAPGHARRARLSRLIALAAVLLLGGVLLVLAVRGVSWSAMGATIQHGQPLYLALAFATLSVSFCLRGLRWSVLLNAEKPVTPLTGIWGIAVGYLGNFFLPARAGELIRSAMIARATALSTSYVLATALTERIVDAVALVLISLLTLTAVASMPGWLLAASKVTAVVGLGGLVVLFLAPRYERVLSGLLTRLPLPSTVRARLVSLLAQFLLGMRALQEARRALSFASLTAVVWLIDSVVAIEVATAFHLALAVPQALLLLAALGLASAVPSTPGFVGVYQFVAATVLTPFGFSRSQALVFIIALQAVNYAVVIVWGGTGFWRLSAAAARRMYRPSEPRPMPVDAG